MLTLKKVAVTGGLASGKTSVCQILENCGAYVIDADRTVHQLLSPDSVIGQQVIELLGSEILSDHQFDRNKIAKKVFSNRHQLEALEQIIHPVVLDEIKKSYQKVKDLKQYSLFVAEIPLLFETQSETFFDVVIFVEADETLSKQRFQKKTGHSVQEYELRMARQFPLHEKAAKAHFTISNNHDLDHLKKETIKIYSNITL